jgi:hypothetical protein
MSAFPPVDIVTEASSSYLTLPAVAFNIFYMTALDFFFFFCHIRRMAWRVTVTLTSENLVAYTAKFRAYHDS